MKQAIFLYNPLSGDRSIAGKLDYMMEQFQKHQILLQPFRITKKSMADLPELLSQNRYDFVVVAGGDGTLNSVLNVVLKTNASPPIGIIPAGTSNDLARCIELNSSVEYCVDVILKGKVQSIDVGLIDEERYFFSSCAGGLFVDASFHTDSELKKNFGPLAYYLKALTDVTHVKPFKLKIETETEVFHDSVLLFLILNGKHAAGFTNVTKEADITDGIMDIILIKNCSHIDLATLFFKLLSNELVGDPNVLRIKTSDCTVECNRKVGFSIDGEDGGALPKRIRFVKQSLQVFVP